MDSMNIPGMEIKHHDGPGIPITFADRRLRLIAHGRQKKNDWEDGHYILKHCKDALGADALEHLLKNPDEIPKKWEGKLICFFGTVYEPKSAGAVHENQIVMPTRYIRFLYKSGGQWKSELLGLDDQFGLTRLSLEWRQSLIKRIINMIFS